MRKHNGVLRPLLVRWRGAHVAPLIAAFVLLGCSCGPIDLGSDGSPDAADAACVSSELCSEEPQLLAVGDEPNREFPYGGASLQIVGDHMLGAAHIAGRRGEGSPGEVVVFHYSVGIGTFEVVDRRPDAIGLVRGGRTADAATVIVPVDTSSSLWARRYRLSAEGIVSADTFPMRGSAAPVDITPGG